MARAALGLGVRELAALAKVSIDTVARFERGEELKERTVEALSRALEEAGVEFTNGDQPGVRLSKAATTHSAKPVSASRAIITAKRAGSRSTKASREKR
jgi:transcriptional regulator with XRE-family HTH domain